jgi:hypothetical protein
VPGLGTHLAVRPDKLSAKTGETVTFTITALDYKNNIATNYTDTIAITSTDGAATLPANASLAVGVGTFAVVFNTAGLQSITATDTAAASINGASAGIVVK